MDELRFHRSFVIQSSSFLLSYPYVNNALPVFCRLLISSPHLLEKRLKERVFKKAVLSVNSAVSLSPYLKGLNSKSPLAMDFLVICMDVCKLKRAINLAKPCRSDWFKTALGLKLKL